MGFKFDNGIIVEEKITGFTGTITGRANYLTGCNQYLLVARCKDSSTEATGVWYDEGRLKKIADNVKPEDVAADENGSWSTPVSGRCPTRP